MINFKIGVLTWPGKQFYTLDLIGDGMWEGGTVWRALVWDKSENTVGPDRQARELATHKCEAVADFIRQHPDILDSESFT
jgi:hypothetical protein